MKVNPFAIFKFFVRDKREDLARYREEILGKGTVLGFNL